MRVLAPAKINLHLRVGRRRDDGFHPLLTWMCTVGLFDTLTLEADADALLLWQPAADRPPAGTYAGEGANPAGAVGTVHPADADVELVICGDGDRPDLPRGGNNLVARIATAFVDALRQERSLGRARPDGRRRGPAFREEGFQGPHFDPEARAAPDGEGGSTASVGAAPPEAPGMAGEGPAGPGDSRGVDDPPVTGPAVRGAGAVRGSERSGRSPRRHEGTAGERSRGAGRAVARVTLDKRIPIGAGLGGGSADAAYTLVALDRLLAARWAEERLLGFGAGFGSDVPFFVGAALGAPSAACRGRGEVVRPVKRPAARQAVIFSPPFGLSTRDVYGRFDAMKLGFDGELEAAAEPDWDRWAGLPARELMTRLVNDLEPAAFSLRPDLASLRRRIEQEVGRVVRMSGSGSSLFTLFDAGEEDRALAAAAVGNGAGGTSVVVDVAPATT